MVKDGRVWGFFSLAHNGGVNTITASENAPITIHATKTGCGQFVECFKLRSQLSGKQTATFGAKLDVTAATDGGTPVYGGVLAASEAKSRETLNASEVEFKAKSGRGLTYGLRNTATTGGLAEALIVGDAKIHAKSSGGNSFALSVRINAVGSRAETSFEKAVEIKASSEIKNAYGIYQSVYAGSEACATFAGPATVVLGNGGHAAAHVYSDGNNSKSILNFKGSVELNAANHTRFGWAVQSLGNGSHIMMGQSDGKDVNVLGHLYSEAGGVIDASFKTLGSRFTGASSLGNSKDGITNLTFSSGGKWDMPSKSTVASLAMGSGGVVNYGATNSPYENLNYLTLKTNVLSGVDGLFRMRGDVEALVGICWSLMDAARVHIAFSTLTILQSQQQQRRRCNWYIVVLRVTAPLTPPSALPTPMVWYQSLNPSIPQTPGARVELGGFLYQIGRSSQSKAVAIADTNENNWYLFPVVKQPDPEPEPQPDTEPQPTPAADAGINFVGLKWILAREELATLTQRMGDLRSEVLHDGTPVEGDGWVRYRRSKYYLDETRTTQCR